MITENVRRLRERKVKITCSRCNKVEKLSKSHPLVEKELCEECGLLHLSCSYAMCDNSNRGIHFHFFEEWVQVFFNPSNTVRKGYQLELKGYSHKTFSKGIHTTSTEEYFSFCSLKCKEEFMKIEKKCKCCGTIKKITEGFIGIFTIKKYWFCSVECLGAYDEEWKRKQYKKNSRIIRNRKKSRERKVLRAREIVEEEGLTKTNACRLLFCNDLNRGRDWMMYLLQDELGIRDTEKFVRAFDYLRIIFLRKSCGQPLRLNVTLGLLFYMVSKYFTVMNIVTKRTIKELFDVSGSTIRKYEEMVISSHLVTDEVPNDLLSMKGVRVFRSVKDLDLHDDSHLIV